MKIFRSFVTLSFINSRAAMPTTYGCRAFFVPLLAIAVANTIAVVAPCALSVIDIAVPGNRNLAAGSAATAIFLSMPEGCDRAITLLSVMVSKDNCQTYKVGSPAKAAHSPLRARTRQLLSDYFTDFDQVEQMRRHLRTWFLSNALDREEKFGQTLGIQIMHYEILDELLSELMKR